MITREQIKLFLQNIASSHYNIHTFGWGDVPDLLARENVIYPYMMVTPVPSTFEDGYINYGYLVSIADRIREGNQNEVEVDSDTFNIMMQVITQIDNLLYNDVDLVKGQTITPFMEAHRHRVSGHFSELQIRVKYNYDACAIPSDEVPLPLPPPPSCAVANYRVEYENGTLIEAGTIPSGGSKTIEVPDPNICANATWELRDENGNLLDSGSVASGGSVTIEAPNADLLIRNSLNQTLYNLSLLSGSNGTQTIGDSSIRLEDSVGTLIANSSVVAEGSATITAPDATFTINGDASFSPIPSGGAENVLVENTNGTPVGAFDINSNSWVIPDQAIEVNTVNEGAIPSVGTIEIDITDGTNPVTPNDVTIVGRKVTLEVPTSAPPSTGTFLVRFFDIDGTILKEERRNAGQDATAPPTPNYDPTYLVFAEWNQPFTNVQNDIDVGAIYDTIDGKTYLFVRITDTTGLQPTLQLNKSTTNLMTINWGDSTTNTSTTSGNQTLTKTAAYAAIGDYIITIEDTGNFQVSTASGYLLGNNTTYSSALLKLYMGSNMVLTIGTNFTNHRSLSIVSINKLSVVPNNAFAGCVSLIHCNLTSLSTTIANTFDGCNSLKSISIPQTITSISGNPFRNCFALQKLILTSVITASALSNSGFENCFSLEKVILNNSLSSMAGASHFQFCRSLKSINIPNTFTTISNLFFGSCISLTELELPDTITSVGSNQAFGGCTSILEYTFLSTTPPTNGATSTFTGINAACKIYVPDASVAAYKAASNWTVVANHIYPLSTKP